MRKFAGALSVLILLISGAFAQRRPTMGEYEVRELMDAYRAVVLSPEQSGNLWDIYHQLNESSGMNYTFLLGQTFQWGQAHAGGIIILDRSITVKQKDVIAFVMAHEWGHEALGHQPNLYHPIGSPWRLRTLPTSDEDAADEYSAEFLQNNDFDVCAVVRFLRNTPRTYPGDSHSDGVDRAQHVMEAAGVRSCGGERRSENARPVKFTVEITPIQIGALGAEVAVYIDGRSVGTVSNAGETSLEVSRFMAGRHTWRLASRVYRFDPFGRPLFSHTLEGSGSMSIEDGDSFLIKGYTTNISLQKQ